MESPLLGGSVELLLSYSGKEVLIQGRKKHFIMSSVIQEVQLCCLNPTELFSERVPGMDC